MPKDTLQIPVRVSLAGLAAQARESHLVGFAATVGMPVEKARPIHAETEAGLASNMALAAERMKEEAAVLPLLDLLQKMTPAGEPIKVNPGAMLDQAKSMGIVLPERNIHLAMGRLVAQQPLWGFGRYE